MGGTMGGTMEVPGKGKGKANRQVKNDRWLLAHMHYAGRVF